jgi:hypothetical protein
LIAFLAPAEKYQPIVLKIQLFLILMGSKCTLNAMAKSEEVAGITDRIN